MRAFAIIRGGGFGPEQIARLDAVFANAWRELTGRYAAVHGESEPEARERLARIIVTLAKGNVDDEDLIEAAVASFEGHHTRRRGRRMETPLPLPPLPPRR